MKWTPWRTQGGLPTLDGGLTSAPPEDWRACRPDLRLLSVRQPHAWAICGGHKDVENRTWRFPYEMPCTIGIQAGVRTPDAPDGLDAPMDVPDDLPRGCALGVVDVISDHDGSLRVPQAGRHPVLPVGRCGSPALGSRPCRPRWDHPIPCRGSGAVPTASGCCGRIGWSPAREVAPRLPSRAHTVFAALSSRHRAVSPGRSGLRGRCGRGSGRGWCRPGRCRRRRRRGGRRWRRRGCRRGGAGRLLEWPDSRLAGRRRLPRG